MATINFFNVGLRGPTEFDLAGDARIISIATNNSVEIGGRILLEVTGGVILEFGKGSALDESFYSTASTDFGADSSLKSNITITFDEPISNFAVRLYNGLGENATYEVSDNGSTKDDIFVSLGGFGGGF